MTRNQIIFNALNQCREVSGTGLFDRRPGQVFKWYTEAKSIAGMPLEIGMPLVSSDSNPQTIGFVTDITPDGTGSWVTGVVFTQRMCWGDFEILEESIPDANVALRLANAIQDNPSIAKYWIGLI